jgi:asparagine synthase (glutamine-hydrolysing)
VKKDKGGTVNERQLLDLAQATERWAPDGTFVRANRGIGMGFQAYHTHQISNIESQPFLDYLGNMITLDGRLDNREELSQFLGLPKEGLADSQIILKAFAHWGEECFRRFIGDWALALWSKRDQTVYLARDHAGTRSLYYYVTADTLQWSTYLETFLCGSDSFPLDNAYASCYMANLPIRDLTPYQGIRAVTPAHFVRFCNRRVECFSHWQWMTGDLIRYKVAQEYDAHFLSLFERSVIRRSGSGAPVLAQLSGGMDSSSIVCVSDAIRIREGVGPDGLLDTISYYDDSEPSLNDEYFFTIVEQTRGKKGIHIESSFSARTYEPPDSPRNAYVLPGADSSFLQREVELETQIGQTDYRALLSGIGGDELLGGVPTPLPELADHLAHGELRVMARRTVQWCLVNRSPLGGMALESLKFLLSCHVPPKLGKNSIPPWLAPSAAIICKDHFCNDKLSIAENGHSPSQVSNGRMWWDLMETMPHRNPAYLKRREYRYPFLDRDLVDYLLRIPREQLIQPGRRRHLMRRTLAGIVPKEVIERRRKGFCARGPLISLRRFASSVGSNPDSLLVVQSGFVQPDELSAALTATCRESDSRWSMCLMRTFAFEAFLRSEIVTSNLVEAPALR